MKAIGKSTEGGRKANEGLPVHEKLIYKPSKITDNTSTHVTFRGE